MKFESRSSSGEEIRELEKSVSIQVSLQRTLLKCLKIV